MNYEFKKITSTCSGVVSYHQKIVHLFSSFTFTFYSYRYILSHVYISHSVWWNFIMHNWKQWKIEFFVLHSIVHSYVVHVLQQSSRMKHELFEKYPRRGFPPIILSNQSNKCDMTSIYYQYWSRTNACDSSCWQNTAQSRTAIKSRLSAELITFEKI
jgi:hypothetical protein